MQRVNRRENLEGKINKREIELDPKYKDKTISKFVNVVMFDGKKTTAEKIDRKSVV